MSAATAAAPAVTTESPALARANALLAAGRALTKAESEAAAGDMWRARGTLECEMLRAIYGDIDRRFTAIAMKEIAARTAAAQQALDDRSAQRPAHWRALSHERRVLLLAQDKITSTEGLELLKILEALIEANTAAMAVPATFEPPRW